MIKPSKSSLGGRGLLLLTVAVHHEGKSGQELQAGIESRGPGVTLLIGFQLTAASAGFCIKPGLVPSHINHTEEKALQSCLQARLMEIVSQLGFPFLRCL